MNTPPLPLYGPAISLSGLLYAMAAMAGS